MTKLKDKKPTKDLQKEDWEEDVEFEILNYACFRGGADFRALPHYIKSLLLQQRKLIIEEIGKAVKKLRVKRHSVSIRGTIEKCCKCKKDLFLDEVLEILKIKLGK